ncbi:heavy-metal-associated domain-containing protein [Flavobacterium sp. GT3R68]|uniref:heavy-metal-associated domain-containing protein n=1 Tax=Flavobacterium sp. GT3R68 TaxID=2594437 RepID=UPI000F8746E9|nr:heavy metal-associated domain-containing protein [Flavobacterium sp. GT3R68]RTY89850.1 heavy-metal-associated domain-containing protein [Flavobacterium sp. GSN2]TRW89829.1 heavy-metal-associated domain-containing protein [Flavobacterium sp. GT3R68]
MKKLIMMLAVALIPFLGTAQIKKANIQASGLTCSMCSIAVLKSLKTVAFIENIESDVETSTFKVTFKEGQNVELDALQKAVEKAGFSVSKLTFTMNVDNLNIKNAAHTAVQGKTFHFVNVKEKTLNGDVEFKLLNKNFISAKEFKKVKDKLSTETNTRVYNVTL